jgi:hypothetical protein
MRGIKQAITKVAKTIRAKAPIGALPPRVPIAAIFFVLYSQSLRNLFHVEHATRGCGPGAGTRTLVQNSKIILSYSHTLIPPIIPREYRRGLGWYW